jgi:hypothetical protein
MRVPATVLLPFFGPVAHHAGSSSFRMAFLNSITASIAWCYEARHSQVSLNLARFHVWNRSSCAITNGLLPATVSSKRIVILFDAWPGDTALVSSDHGYRQ